MLQAFDIHVRINGKPILHGADFCARAGQFTAIVGPNGSGKSTLLKAITGEIPFDGQVILNGLNPATLKPWELAAIRGVLPQATTLAFPFTTAEVLRMGLRAGTSGAATALADRALAAVGLAGYGPRFYQELSGGEQQRSQLARVLCQVWDPMVAGIPRWLLLDEPVASLDIGHQLIVMRLLANYAARGGGVVAVMHDLNLSAMFADQMAVVSAGRVTSSGTPSQVMTDDILSDAYHCALRVNTTPQRGQSFVLPHASVA